MISVKNNGDSVVLGNCTDVVCYGNSPGNSGIGVFDGLSYIEFSSSVTYLDDDRRVTLGSSL